VGVISHALVTGANGFIGSNLCAALRAHGVPVRALVLPGSDCSNIAGEGVDVVAADIAEPLSAEHFAGISHVFHLAAIALDWGPASLFERVNVQGTAHVLQGSIEGGVGHFIHMSSLAVHPYTGYTHGDEGAPRGSRMNAYTETKSRAEELVLSRQGEIRVTIVRPGVVPYGPGDRLSLPGILDALDRGIYAHVGGGNTLVSVSFVGNLVEGMILAATRESAVAQTYILSDDVVSWRGLIDAIADAFGKPRASRGVPFPLAWLAAALVESAYRLLPLRGVPPLTRYRISLFRGDLVFPPDKAARELGYHPPVGLEEGLRRTALWMRRNSAG